MGKRFGPFKTRAAPYGFTNFAPVLPRVPSTRTRFRRADAAV